MWAGPAQIAFAPFPEWLGPSPPPSPWPCRSQRSPTVSVSPRRSERTGPRTPERPALARLGTGLIFTVVVAVTTSVATFESASALVAFTPYWDGVLYLALFGVGGMFVAAWAYQTLPAMTGRLLADPAAASRQVRWTLWFVGGTGTAAHDLRHHGRESA
jgi:hypothetical protein